MAVTRQPRSLVDLDGEFYEEQTARTIADKYTRYISNATTRDAIKMGENVRQATLKRVSSSRNRAVVFQISALSITRTSVYALYHAPAPVAIACK
jgi:hypothetical protein